MVTKVMLSCSYDWLPELGQGKQVHLNAPFVGWTTYFIQGEITKNVKIGKTGNALLTRMNQMQSSDKLIVLATVEGDHEAAYHQRFRHLWSHGEWFKPGQDLLDCIAALPKSEQAGMKQNVLASWVRHGSNAGQAMSRAQRLKISQSQRKRLAQAPRFQQGADPGQQVQRPIDVYQVHGTW